MSQLKYRFWLCLISTIVVGITWASFEWLLGLRLPAITGLIIALSSGLIVWMTTSATFFRRFVGEATPESLGAIRIIVCTILLIMVLWVMDFPSSALLPEEMRHSMGVMKFFHALPGFENFTRSQTSLQLFKGLTVILLLLGIIGWQTRIVIPLGALCCCLIGGLIRQYSWFFHTGLIPIYLMAILSFTPCGDGLSIDRLRKINQGKDVPIADRPLPIYGWSRYACWVMIALPYVAAGLSKIRNGGWMWWGATNMRYQLYQTALAPMQFDFSLAVHLNHAPDILFALLGIAGVYGEVVYGLVLFSRRARWILPIFMVTVHIGILFFQDILFLDLILLQLVFFDFTQIRKAITRRFGSHREESPVFAFTSVSNNFRSVFYSLFISGLMILLLVCWYYRIEFYPLTAMQMFSNNNSTGRVSYAKLLAHNDSGAIVTVYPENILPVMFDTRYRQVINGCFSPKIKVVHTCERFLETIGSLHNTKAEEGEKFQKLEVQLWRWDFRQNPSDPKHGDLVKNYVVQVN